MRVHSMHVRYYDHMIWHVVHVRTQFWRPKPVQSSASKNGREEIYLCQLVGRRFRWCNAHLCYQKRTENRHRPDLSSEVN